MEKLATLVEDLTNLTAVEIADLQRKLESKWGVRAPAVVQGTPQNPRHTDPVVEEQTEFTLTIDAAGSNKIGVIKVVREVTGLGLKEAKDLVDQAPKNVLEGVDRGKADDVAQKLRAAGATVSVR